MRRVVSLILALVALLVLGGVLYFTFPLIFGSLVVQIPDQYRGLVEEKSNNAGIDPCFLAATVQAESRWRPEAKSPVGARGLGQLMPGTASSVARLYGVSYNPSQITDPAKNLELASYLIRYNFDKYGSIRNALVAYNAGGGRVRLSDAQLPRETQRYIRTVSTYYEVYRSTYPSFCKGNGNGLGTGVLVRPQTQTEDFPDFPEVKVEETNVNINDLWKAFLGV